MSGFDFQFSAAIQGNFDTETRRAKTRIARAARFAMEQTSKELQADLRHDVEASGLAKGAALAKTWRRDVYPKNAAVQTMGPAAVVYTNFPKIIAAFEEGRTIRSKSGKFLLIPNPAVWPGGRLRRTRSSSGWGGGSETLQAARARFGQLQFVKTKTGGILVAEAAFSQKTGRFRKLKISDKQAATAGFVKTGHVTIIVFFLVRQARLPKLLKGADIRRAAAQTYPRRLEALFTQQMNATADR